MRKPDTDIAVSAEAREIHERSLVVDLHTDSLFAARFFGLDLSRRHRPPRGVCPWMLQADIPRMREGGLDAVWLGVFTHPFPRGAWSRAQRTLAYARYVLEKNRDTLALATTPREIEAVRSQGKIAVLLGIEGMHILEGRLERIEELYDAGVRYITMAHFTSNRFAVSSADPFRRKASLGALGREAVEEMKALGMMIDLAHVHTDLIGQVCGASSMPVIVSHGATQALRPVFRNLSDADIEAVAATGGVIGLIYAAEWLAEHGSRPGLEAVVDHADHITELVGAGHVALGSDFDGMIDTPAGLRDVSRLPALTQLLLKRGYSVEEVEGILAQNFMRAFRAVQPG